MVSLSDFRILHHQGLRSPGRSPGWKVNSAVEALLPAPLNGLREALGTADATVYR